MGIEIIRLGNEKEEIENLVELEKLAPLNFQSHATETPPMSIWLMTVPGGKPVFPWWSYDAALDEDVKLLHDFWSISSPQTLLDCLFFSQLKKFAGPNLYVIFPGRIRAHGWTSLKETDRAAYMKGVACIYHMEGAYKSQLNINWVPFWQPQSMVKDPSLGSLWRIFMEGKPDDVANSLSFFSLSDTKLLPKVVHLLTEPNSQRSEKLAELVDWYGLYSSPINDNYGTCSVVYSKRSMTLMVFKELERQFKELIGQTRSSLAGESHPRTVLRLLSRLIAL